MKFRRNNSFTRLISMILLFTGVSCTLFFKASFETHRVQVILNQQAKLSSQDNFHPGNSLNNVPVNVPAPTINNFLNGNSLSALSDPSVSSAGIQHSRFNSNYLTFSGNPVFPYALQSPRLHLACMVMRI